MTDTEILNWLIDRNAIDLHQLDIGGAPREIMARLLAPDDVHPVKVDDGPTPPAPLADPGQAPTPPAP